MQDLSFEQEDYVIEEGMEKLRYNDSADQY